MEFSGLPTRWTPSEIPLAEYPRPQMQRNLWQCLNGSWEYAITGTETLPEVFDGAILVPYSPESLLSGVRRGLLPGQYLHYFRLFTLPDAFSHPRVLLHFGAVDRDCAVFVNGKKAGTHEGGYNAFVFDITALLVQGKNTLHVAVTDDTEVSGRTRGKQQLNRGGIWYTPSSGIWQTVWLENVPDRYLSALEICPDYDASAVRVRLCGTAEKPYAVTVRCGGSVLAEVTAEATDSDGFLSLKLPGFTPWSPEQPYLYDLEVRAGRDLVRSYFGMRKFEIKTDDYGNKRFFLNNEPYFMHGLLDQGYFSDGLYTAPCDEALSNDVEQAKLLGFNTLRKHIKVEPLRWYYHCDRLGMLVWQDMPSGGEQYKKRVTMYYPFVGIRLSDAGYRLFGRAKKELRDEFYREYGQMITQLKNVTSLALWVPFNEGWGQFDARKAELFTRRLDPSRLVDHASGWHDQGGGDFTSLHVYFKKVPRLCAGKRAVILSEFGGYSMKIDGHSFNPGKAFGYKLFTGRGELNAAFCRLYEEQVIPHIGEGLCADIYTQLTDVEDEVNGLLTYDRALVKIDAGTASRVRDGIAAEMSRLFPRGSCCDKTPQTLQ